MKESTIVNIEWVDRTGTGHKGALCGFTVTEFSPPVSVVSMYPSRGLFPEQW